MNFQLHIALAVFIARVGAQSALTVNTPTSVQACLPQQFTWVGGTGPYYLTLILGGDAGSAIQKDFGKIDGTTYTWPAVDLPAGGSYTLSIKDSTGAINYSDKFTIQSSTQTCSAANSTTTGTTTGTSTASTTPATTNSTAVSTGGKNSTTTSGTTSGGKTSTGSTASTSTGSTSSGSASSTGTTSSTSGTSSTNTTAGKTAASTSGSSHVTSSALGLVLSAALVLFV